MARAACLSVVIPKFCHSINREEWAWPINILYNTLFANTKICHIKNKVHLSLEFFSVLLIES